MNIAKKIIIYCSIILLSACSKDKKKLVGWWSIDDILIKNESRITYLSINTLTFNSDGTCSLPLFDFKGTKAGKWHIEEDEDDRYLVIESKK